ncbi:ABC transporter permease [Mucilaginibacter panaciglaebae]|uniref:ABC transporter permease n=1 Tax=Mucilaginibacter panaciglaebae TaxID=502331 RepID=A0ABP7WSB8_9SPHI
MIKNYIKIAWRNVVKNAMPSSINIAGLAVGLASFIVILIYLNYELSYDKWDPSLKKVYKVSFKEKGDVQPTTPAPLAYMLAHNHPNIEAATCIQPDDDYQVLMATADKKIFQDGIVTVADSSFFKVFPYQLAIGNVNMALLAPDAIILSQEVSQKLFGHSNPMGKTIKMFDQVNCVVTGVLKDAATPTHFSAKVLMRDPWHKTNNFWGNYSFLTYIKLKHPVADRQLEASLNRVYFVDWMKRFGKPANTKRSDLRNTIFTDKVGNIHNFPKYGASNFKITLVLLVLAIFLLIASAINFSNLTIVRAITRAREVGIRKVLGSTRWNIIFQSLLEISIQCLISLILASALVSLLLPYFSNSFNVPLSFSGNENAASLCLQIAGILVAIILVSGLYPALFLSNFRVATVLKGDQVDGGKGVFFRNSLLVVQLTLSALFITGIVIINRQLNYIQNKDLGLNPSQVVRIEALQQSRESNFSTVRNTLLAIPGVEYVSKTTSVPGSTNIDTNTAKFGFEGSKYRLNSVKISADFFKTLGIKLVEGRYFDDSYPEDLDNTAIINESAAKRMHIKYAIGKNIIFPYCDTLPYHIVGVVKDFNVQSLENMIVPTIYSISNQHCGFRSGGAILIKLKTDSIKSSMAAITAAWKKFEPAYPIRYSFLDQNFKNLYVTYHRLSTIILFFSAISVLIAVSGLFALTSFLAQLRVKEIGVRKVLGASVANITTLLSKDFVKLVILSIVIATPIAFWALSKWLNDFAYRISLQWWMFALSGVLVVAITLLTVGSQAMRSAMANPVKSLRSE